MNKHWLIIGLGAGVISLVIIATGVFDRTSPQPETASAPPTEAKPLQETTSSESALPSASSQAENTASLTAIEQANQDLIAAQLTLNNAENEMERLEIEMEDVEGYVESLEQRGEDPAKYAEEGMLLLGPVIEKYETTLAVVEAAEEEIERAQTVLSELKQ